MSPRRVTHLAGGCTRGRKYYWFPQELKEAGVDCALCRRTIAGEERAKRVKVEVKAQNLVWDAIHSDPDPKRSAEALVAAKRLLDQLNCDPVVGVAALDQLADAHRDELESLVLGERVLRSLGGAA